MKKVIVTTRTFQAGADINRGNFDMLCFNERVASPIKKLLESEIVERIVVITNGEIGNKLSESIIDGNKTATILALEESFSEEIKNERIIGHICTDWGPNPGSATALNDGAEIAKCKGAEWILNWSPEIEMNDNKISLALDLAQKRKLSVVGFLREHWQEKVQWQVAQNTAALWHLETLMDINGFAPECNGTGESVYIDSLGNVPLAGMEDFHAMLRLLKSKPNFRWGMIGQNDPLKWHVDFDSNSERQGNHTVKVERQYKVMQKYAEKIFPNMTFNEVMQNLFSCCYKT